MADYASEEFFTNTREGQEAVVAEELDFVDDVETVPEKVVVPANAAAQGIFHREYGAISNPELDGLECDLKLVARDGFAVWIGFATSKQLTHTISAFRARVKVLAVSMI